MKAHKELEEYLTPEADLQNPSKKIKNRGKTAIFDYEKCKSSPHTHTSDGTRMSSNQNLDSYGKTSMIKFADPSGCQRSTYESPTSSNYSRSSSVITNKSVLKGIKNNLKNLAEFSLDIRKMNSSESTVSKFQCEALKNKKMVKQLKTNLESLATDLGVAVPKNTRLLNNSTSIQTSIQKSSTSTFKNMGVRRLQSQGCS
jgi:hypothetical protein